MRPLFVRPPTPSTQNGRDHGASAARAERRFRPEVQGLRAVAVLLVLVYHLDPDLVPGGYVGVDVFFVISGFLITSLLYREAGEHGRISIARFYVRRVRRLLPASTVVLLVTGAVALVFLPITRLSEAAWQLIASAAYVENLYLAQQAVDYLASDAPPSPVQHFWSLAVEEQFYLVWPLLFMLWAGAVQRWRTTPRVLVAGLSVLSVVSLAHSVVHTAQNPAAAYFLPTTRAWELAVGGLVAVVLAHRALSPAARAPLVWAGLAAIGVSALAYDDATAFPGWTALLPVLGSAAVIAAGHTRTPLNTAPAQFFGDISYSLYLWHWPLIVFALTWSGSASLGLLEMVAVAAAAVLLSWLTKVWVEDPVRERGLIPGIRTAGVVALSGIVAVSAVGFASLARVQQFSSVPFDPRVHVGPAALSQGSASNGAELYPPLVEAEEDNPQLYEDDCQGQRRDVEPRTDCVYGDPDGEWTVLVVGDSHAAQWVPALDRVGDERGWRVVSLTKSACAFTAVPVRWNDGSDYEECEQWNAAVMEELAGMEPDVVFSSASRNVTPQDPGDDAAGVLADGLVRQWEEAARHTDRLVAMRDTPVTDRDVFECLEEHNDDLSQCSVPREVAFEDVDPQVQAARAMEDDVHLLDMSDLFCGDDRCAPVIGNVVVYRDYHHMTASYSQMLSEELAERIEQVTG
ncbi:acyltransferase [Nocardiopsis kunsanensis]|uniref:Acyltransferase n=1 Tax=Nocardiopsis kunsanensis TaxID=141693 RepID=A0A918XBF7_9ACTN|nr:acyltransferase family protein [Nocardiopsis kunsanensis]GHD21721.1 acyltransferase [Nocardiopsis kunsanensis]